MRHRLLPPPRTAAWSVGLVLALLGGASGAAADAPGDTIVDDPPVLATAAVRTGAPIDGIPSGPMVSGGFHIHAHLTLYIDGKEMWVPAGVGVTRPLVLDPDRADPMITAAKGFYWLHTHDESGVIHAEAPAPHPFTLGQFFDVWGQPLSRKAVGPATGNVWVLIDGKPFTGEPRSVPIKQHELIQLNVGRDVPFQSYQFPPDY
ncbi:MAG: hypothetical protein HOV87_30650 [Catenulispora sp.]|nr:hypothetical protein [Catenulispora sp.]